MSPHSVSIPMVHEHREHREHREQVQMTPQMRSAQQQPQHLVTPFMNGGAGNAHGREMSVVSLGRVSKLSEVTASVMSAEDRVDVEEVASLKGVEVDLGLENGRSRKSSKKKRKRKK